VRIHILGSGSRGNAIVLESGEDRVLIDAGFGPRVLAHRMRAAAIEPESVSAMVVTHEHTDHIRGAAAAARRWRWPLHATQGTLRSLARTRGLGVSVVEPRHELVVGGVSLHFVRVPHDATEPIALVATAHSSGARVGVVYDVGHVTPRLAAPFADLDVLLLESNHDDEMLRHGPYPRVVQERIAGPRGHLSNADAGLMALACVHRGLRHLVLCHLSQHNNRPDVALRSMRRMLRGTAFRGTLHAADQDRTLTLGVTRPGRTTQLSLF
jgi:phosphoribosyl 1,2-cyclic phosphodiesterase